MNSVNFNKKLLPNLLTWSRIIFSPILPVLAYFGYELIFTSLYTIAVLSDVFDGIIARTLGVASKKGAAMDARADEILYFAIVISIYFIFNEVKVLYILFLVYFGIIYLVTKIAVYLKHRKIRSFPLRLWSSRVNAILIHAGLIALLVLDKKEALPYGLFIVAITGTYCKIEEIVIHYKFDPIPEGISSMFYADKKKNLNR